MTLGNRNFEIIKADVGPVTENDLIESLEFESKIYGMDLTFASGVEQMVKQEGIDVRKFKIIYQLLEDLDKLNDTMNSTYAGLEILGKATIKEAYDIKLNASSR